MDIQQSGETVLIKGIRHFNLKQTFECGQAFRWHKNKDGSYTGVVGERIITLTELKGQEEGTVDLHLVPCSREDVEAIWLHYLDLSTDYDAIQARLGASDAVLREAMAHGDGIRLLNQELWEMILTFILSANNNIPRIAASLEALAETYGQYLGQTASKKWYGLPSPEVLSEIEPEQLRKLGLGYRDKYVVGTAKIMAHREAEWQALFNMDTPAARNLLLTLPGVGPKVAECILLFALGRRDAFPVDTWVKKVMCHYYCDQDATLKEISRFAEERFGDLGGYAQQYLFYYARENRLGQ